MYNECETVINQMNSTGIKSFAIFNLFGRYNVTLKFDKEVNIYVGENGLGKTTILNCLYSVLKKNFHYLRMLISQRLKLCLKRT